jgi:hypothetical protein
LNQIYRELIERRSSSCDPNKKNWIKQLINLYCGFFGFQSELTGGSAGHWNCLICSRVPSTYNVSSHQIDVQHGFAHLNEVTYYVKSFSFFSNRHRAAVAASFASPANNVLALFFTVVKMGKLRLV